MERLEAAMEKARTRRATNLAKLGADTPYVRRSRGGAAADWTAVQEIQISPAEAERHLITTLGGGRAAGPYDMLRSRTLRVMSEKGWHRLAITSPNAACGKTTVSLNLAFSLARQRDIRVIVIDLDMRRPHMHIPLGLRNRPGFADVIDGAVSFEEQAVRVGDNLIFALNYQAVRNSSELLQSRRTAEVIARIEDSYRPDIVIFDMPPMLAADDNVGFLGNVDCALLVAAAEKTTIPQIDVCEKELAELTNVLGVTLNKCRYTDAAMGYESGYY